jgi:hypothetical protein
MGRRGWRCILAGVICHVPPGAFELHGGGGNQLINRILTALRANRKGRVRKLYDALKTMGAITAFVLV